MSRRRIGIWFIGARGGVAATATLGLVALEKQLAGNVGLVSCLPRFASLDLAPWDEFVVGGHEIRDGSIAEAVDRLHSQSRVFDAAVMNACRGEFAAIDARIRPGSLANC